MHIGTTHAFSTSSGRLDLMLVEDTIVGYREGDVLVHHMPAHQAEKSGYDSGVASMGFHLSRAGQEDIIPLLVVGMVRHPSDTLIGFYLADWDFWYAWGYVWNVDHAERSYWERAERLADIVDPEDLPHMSNTERLAKDLPCVMPAATRLNPRIVALATVSGGNAPDEVAADIPQFLEWVNRYHAALKELEGIDKLRPWV